MWEPIYKDYTSFLSISILKLSANINEKYDIINISVKFIK